MIYIYMCICIYICVYVDVCIYVYVYVYVCIFVWNISHPKYYIISSSSLISSWDRDGGGNVGAPSRRSPPPSIMILPTLISYCQYRCILAGTTWHTEGSDAIDIWSNWSWSTSSLSSFRLLFIVIDHLGDPCLIYKVLIVGIQVDLFAT